jgi:hypothetical protein
VFTVEAKGSVPDVPVDINDAIEVKPIRNRDMPEESVRSDLDPDTIVGYSLLAEYDNSGRVLKEIYYTLHAADGTVIATYTYVLPAGKVNIDPIIFSYENMMFNISEYCKRVLAPGKVKTYFLYFEFFNMTKL